MLALRSVRAVAAAPGAAPGAAPSCGKATAAAQPAPRLDHEEEGAVGRTAAAGARQWAVQHQELLDQLQEAELRIPVPWGHVAGK